MNATSDCYASPAARDAFLTALDGHDRELVATLARNLTGCNNPLPGITCAELGLPGGSTYACAARHVLARDDAGIPPNLP